VVRREFGDRRPQLSLAEHADRERLEFEHPTERRVLGEAPVEFQSPERDAETGSRELCPVPGDRALSEDAVEQVDVVGEFEDELSQEVAELGARVRFSGPYGEGVRPVRCGPMIDQVRAKQLLGACRLEAL
jgi:hypothetical protein